MTTAHPGHAGSGATSLRQRMRTGQLLRGLLVRVPSVHLIDMAGDHGYDFVLLDTEHGIADQRDVAEHITAARAAGLDVLVRIAEGEAGLALRVLDAGAVGVVVPHVASAEGADAAVSLAHYPPRGTRGFATYTPAGRWGRVPAVEHAEHAAATTVVVAMIEDEAGVRAGAEICAVDGIDAVFVGPADLAASMGHNAARADEARRDVWDAAHAAGTPVVAIVGDAAQARAAREQGASVLVLNAQAAVDRCLAAWVLEGPGESDPR